LNDFAHQYLTRNKNATVNYPQDDKFFEEQWLVALS